MAQTWKSQPCQTPPASRSQPSRSQPWQPQGGGWDVPLFCFLGAILAAAGCFFFLLHSLYQPTINRNPGVAAYVPPPGTRLVPLPRKSDAPELADLPADPPSPLTALARAQAGDQPAKRDIRPSPRKHPRTDFAEYDQRGYDQRGYDQRGYDQRGYGFVQQWNNGSRGWNNNRAWSGGPKSWF
jgi:hypothetical protein